MIYAPFAMGAMLAVAEPGVTPASRVVLDSDPGAELLALVGVEANPPGFKWMRASWTEWSRWETPGEGYARWGTIAIAIDRVANDPPPAWRPTWASVGLVRGLVTIARAESAFWKSVHEGRLRGPAGEACLVQVHPETARALGVDLESLVGTDVDATERCFRVGAELLGLAVERCISTDKLPGGWFEHSVVSYWTPDRCEPEPDQEKGIALRSRLYARTGKPKALPFRAMLAVAGT